MINRQLGIHLLQLGELLLNVLEMPQLLHFHAAEPRFPVVIRRLTDAVTTADLAGLASHLHFLKDADDLFFGESGLLHFELLS